jgi:hypothetical protein
MCGYRRSDLLSQHKQLDAIVVTGLISTETPDTRNKVMREIQEKLKLPVYEAFTLQSCAKPRAAAGYNLLPLY